MPNLVEIHRSGSVVWVTVDGYTLPLDWVEDVYTSIDADQMPKVTLTIGAATVKVVNSVNVTGEDDGETDLEEAQAPPQGRVRLSG